MKEVKIQMKRMEEVAGRLFLFSSLSESMKAKFLHEAVMMIAEKGEVIIREGEMEETIYILVDREVEVTKRNGGGENR